MVAASAASASAADRRRRFFEGSTSRQATSRAIIERSGAASGVVDVTELVAAMERPVVIVDGVTQLTERGTVRIGVGVRAAVVVDDASRTQPSNAFRHAAPSAAWLSS